MTSADNFDIIIVGGGLSGALTAWRIKKHHPKFSLALVERKDKLGGNHTWCFFGSDLTSKQRSEIAPLIVKEWPRYSVNFPGHSRVINTEYAAISSQRLHNVIYEELGDSIWLNAPIVDVGVNAVRLKSGQQLTSSCVIDARGVKITPNLALGFQKFLALELELFGPHGVSDPIIMDASVSQDDGYRFVYTLPFSSNRLLIYDTYYSDKHTLPIETLRDRIQDYANEKCWLVKEILREERGVLPIILAGNHQELEAEQRHGAPKIGLAGVLFHPTTGYSLPDAMRVSDLFIEGLRQDDFTSKKAGEIISNYRNKIWNERSFFRLLNRMLFQAGKSNERYKVLERFYRFNEGLIQRFYSAELSHVDRARLTIGKPPVPLLAALKCISEAETLRRWENKL